MYFYKMFTALCMKEGDWNGSTSEKEGRSRPKRRRLYRRRDCRGRRCTTELLGGLCRQTSTPHKSGTKMRVRNERRTEQRIKENNELHKFISSCLPVPEVCHSRVKFA